MQAHSSSQIHSQISFTLSFTEPQAHYLEVEMNITGIQKEFTDVKMPVWAPGSYLVREFARHVERFSACTLNEESLQTCKINKNTWRITTGRADNIKIRYRVYAFEISVRTSFIDISHAFLSPTGIFMYVDEMLNHPVTVTVKPFKTWNKISTGLEGIPNSPNTFYAADFDILFDSPIEIGNQDIFDFKAAGIKHEVAMYGGGNYDKGQLKKDIAQIIEEETAIFGENPNKKYVFIVHNYNTGGGGLEHLNSTVLGASRFNYANENGYKNFLGLVAHEYFHLWNVKRLRPKALGPFDYDTENYTPDLWIAEGFTAYYDNLILRRTNFYSPEKYLEVLSADINTVENQPGNQIQPVREASFDAWIKHYRPNENSKNTTISYYDKGALIAMILDLQIIYSTGAKKSLDDVMKAMYDEYYKRQNRGYTDAEFKAVAEKTSGTSLDKIYSDYVYGTSLIPYNDYLNYAGFRLVNDAEDKNEPFIGITTAVKDGKFSITFVTRQSPAWNCGLNVNDELIGINGYRISSQADLDKMLAGKKPGDKINALISRDAVLQTLGVVLTANPNVKLRIETCDSPTAEQLLVRKKWLKL